MKGANRSSSFLQPFDPSTRSCYSVCWCPPLLDLQKTVSPKNLRDTWRIGFLSISLSNKKKKDSILIHCWPRLYKVNFYCAQMYFVLSLVFIYRAISSFFSPQYNKTVTSRQPFDRLFNVGRWSIIKTRLRWSLKKMQFFFFSCLLYEDFFFTFPLDTK